MVGKASATKLYRRRLFTEWQLWSVKESRISEIVSEMFGEGKIVESLQLMSESPRDSLQLAAIYSSLGEDERRDIKSLLLLTLEKMTKLESWVIPTITFSG